MNRSNNQNTEDQFHIQYLESCKVVVIHTCHNTFYIRHCDIKQVKCTKNYNNASYVWQLVIEYSDAIIRTDFNDRETCEKYASELVYHIYKIDDKK